MIQDIKADDVLFFINTGIPSFLPVSFFLGAPIAAIFFGIVSLAYLTHRKTMLTISLCSTEMYHLQRNISVLLFTQVAVSFELLVLFRWLCRYFCLFYLFLSFVSAYYSICFSHINVMIMYLMASTLLLSQCNFIHLWIPWRYSLLSSHIGNFYFERYKILEKCLAGERLAYKTIKILVKINFKCFVVFSRKIRTPASKKNILYLKNLCNQWHFLLIIGRARWSKKHEDVIYRIAGPLNRIVYIFWYSTIDVLMFIQISRSTLLWCAKPSARISTPTQTEHCIFVKCKESRIRVIFVGFSSEPSRHMRLYKIVLSYHRTRFSILY